MTGVLKTDHVFYHKTERETDLKKEVNENKYRWVDIIGNIDSKFVTEADKSWESAAENKKTTRGFFRIFEKKRKGKKMKDAFLKAAFEEYCLCEDEKLPTDEELLEMFPPNKKD